MSVLFLFYDACSFHITMYVVAVKYDVVVVAMQLYLYLLAVLVCNYIILVNMYVYCVYNVETSHLALPTI